MGMIRSLSKCHGTSREWDIIPFCCFIFIVDESKVVPLQHRVHVGTHRQCVRQIARLPRQDAIKSLHFLERRLLLLSALFFHWSKDQVMSLKQHGGKSDYLGSTKWKSLVEVRLKNAFYGVTWRHPKSAYSLLMKRSAYCNGVMISGYLFSYCVNYFS